MESVEVATEENRRLTLALGLGLLSLLGGGSILLGRSVLLSRSGGILLGSSGSVLLGGGSSILASSLLRYDLYLILIIRIVKHREKVHC